MSLIILTKSPKTNIFSVEIYKTFARKIFNKKRGPQVVTENLLLGLDELKYSYKLNPNKKEIHGDDTIWVNESIDALKFAINTKSTKNKLIVGPNLVVSPLDNYSIMTDKNIDKILLPSDWSADIFSTISPEIKNKIFIWPAGTNCNIDISKNKTNKCLIFKKNTQEKLFENIKKHLNEILIPYDIIEYGKYTRKEYFNKLNNSEFLIYLQESESQGMALQEAWAHNVPTFVWNKGYIDFQNKKFYGKISAPYLTEENGEFFMDFDQFKDKLPKFIENLKKIEPRKYCEENLSINKSSKIFINIIEDNFRKWSND